ncbi:MAG: hypothetical protein FLDDKLPJ_00475 [Phycisphaerae bacterium]|nr:hypothetical protein [Phycisphaerae bacterium]
MQEVRRPGFTTRAAHAAAAVFVFALTGADSQASQPPPAPSESNPTDQRPQPEDDRFTAVFLNPGATGNPWASQVQAVKKHARPIVLPSHAPSGAQPAPIDVQAHARKLLETLKMRRLERCVVFALGADAAIALEMTAQQPEALVALVLIDAAPPDEPADASAPASVWRERLDRIAVPVLAIFRADLMLGVGSAGHYLKATGFDALEQVRVRRIEAADPILSTAAPAVNSRITGFLDDLREGREILPETRHRTDSGLTYIDQLVGDGPRPRAGQTLAARFRFKTRDGRDVSPPGAMNATWRFPLDRTLTDGVYEALSTMQAGGRRKAYIPIKLLKRAEPPGDRTPPDAVLDGQADYMIVDIFLSEVTDDPPPPPRPRWNPALERPVSDRVRIVELKTGEGAEADEGSLVSFASNLWAQSGHLPRFRSVENPERGVLKDLSNPDLGGSATCWLSAIKGMKVGGERLILCKATDAFGNRLLPSIGKNDQVVFHVRLLEAKPVPPPPARDGVDEKAYVVLGPKVKAHDLRVGDGPPADAESAVVFHYTAWREDGTLSDCSLMRDRPTMQTMNALIGPFKAGLPGMRVGGVRQLLVQDPFGPGKNDLKPGEWVTYRIELKEVLTPREFAERSRVETGQPIQIDPQVKSRIAPPS